MFKNHLEMISRNESPSKKAKFWQSFVRSLKGSDDLRAPESVYSPRSRGIFRPLTDLHETTWPFTKSIYDDPIHAGERIHVPGYRYDPLHRDVYGYSPRPIFPHNYGYSPLERYRPVYHTPKPSKSYFDAEKAWDEHLARRAERDRLYPALFDNFKTTYPFSRYPLYLVHSKRPQGQPSDFHDPHRSWLDHLDRLAALDKLYPFGPGKLSPTPIKIGDFAPRPSEIAFNYFGQPIYTRGGFRPTAL